MDTKIAKWGNSLALRLPKAVAESAGLREGDSVTVTLGKQRKLVLARKPKRLTLDELLAGITEENRHEEVPKGPSRGREQW